MQVGIRLGTHRAREADRETTGGVHPTTDDAGDRRGALLAGEERLDHGGAPVERPVHGIRPSRHEDEDDGCAGGEDRLHEVALHPR